MNGNKKVTIGIIGLGTVGRGVIKILKNIEDIVSTKTGGEIVIKKIVTRTVNKDWNSFFDFEFDKNMISNNVDDILQDPEIDIVVELIGGYEPARTYILKALENKKHVVTANKAVLAKYWEEINTVCKKNNTLLYFEASVGAGIPVIQGLNEGLSSNKIQMICGILNGTTNYILTKMLNENSSFESALKMAQEKGFAEADPTFDIKGIDTAHKLAILASLAYQKNIGIDSVYAEGIDKINVEDINFAYKELGFVLKLLAIAKKTENGLELRVNPVFISKNHLLSSVNNEYNAVYIVGDATGEVMFYGKGAGELPAASGVVSDILYVAKHINNETACKTQFVSMNNSEIKILNINDIETCYYLRFEVEDSLGALSQITGILGNHGVSIATCYQHEKNVDITNKATVPVIITTHKSLEKNIKNAIDEINKLYFITKKTVFIRIEGNL
jgi:homoserine dehydrogenase